MSAAPQPQPTPWDDPREVVKLSVDRLVFDRNAQRATSDARVRQIGQAFDYNRAEVLTVTPLGDGRYYVEEGQTRGLALRSACPTATIWCVVTDRPMSPAERAGLGLDISTGRKGHTAWDQWEARVRRGAIFERLAEAAAARYGLRIGPSPSGTTIAAVAAVARMDRYPTPEEGAAAFERVLGIVTTAWPHADDHSRASRFDRRVLAALAEIIRRNPGLDDDRMARGLSRKMASRWVDDITDAKGSSSRAVALDMLTVYNRNLRSRALTW